MPGVLPRCPENRVISMDSGAWTYVYDANGRRIQRAGGSHTYVDLYDLSGRIVTEYMDSASGWNRSEIYAAGLHLGSYSHSANQTYFHHGDWLGSERVTTDSSGTAKTTCTNLPFGDGASCSNGPFANALFTGDEHDAESNTEHTDFRQLATTQGRWLSPDPYMGSMDITNPQSLNRYVYVGNDPINSNDPSGLDPCNDPQSCAAYYTNFSTHWAGASAPSGFGWTQLTLVGWSLSNPQQVPTGNWVLTPILTGTNADGKSFSGVTELPEMTTVYPGIPFLTPIGGGYETSTSVGGGGGAGGNGNAKPTPAGQSPLEAATQSCQDNGQFAFKIPFTKTQATISGSFSAILGFSTTNDISVTPSVGASVDFTVGAPEPRDGISVPVQIGVGKHASVGTFLTTNGPRGLSVSIPLPVPTYGPTVTPSPVIGNVCGLIWKKS